MIVAPVTVVLLVRILAYFYRGSMYEAGIALWWEDLGRLVGRICRRRPVQTAPVIRAEHEPEQWLRRQLAALEVELRIKECE